VAVAGDNTLHFQANARNLLNRAQFGFPTGPNTMSFECRTRNLTCQDLCAATPQVIAMRRANYNHETA
jgi:hypothetical protein